MVLLKQPLVICINCWIPDHNKTRQRQKHYIIGKYWLISTSSSEIQTCLENETNVISTHHYDDVIMTMLASQITSLTVVYSIVYSGVNQRKHQSSASLAFVREIHRGPVNFPHKWPVTRKMFPFDDVIMMIDLINEIKMYLANSSHAERRKSNDGIAYQSVIAIETNDDVGIVRSLCVRYHIYIVKIVKWVRVVDYFVLPVLL